jgi:hypothetical protein
LVKHAGHSSTLAILHPVLGGKDLTSEITK